MNIQSMRDPEEKLTLTKRPNRRSISRVVRKHVYERDDWSCQYCGVEIRPDTDKQKLGINAPFFIDANFRYVYLELDHVIPYSRGGLDTIKNLRSACSPCNGIKGVQIIDCGWESRILTTQDILRNGEVGRSTIQRAARELLGVNVYIADNGNVSIRNEN